MGEERYSSYTRQVGALSLSSGRGEAEVELEVGLRCVRGVDSAWG